MAPNQTLQSCSPLKSFSSYIASETEFGGNSNDAQKYANIQAAVEEVFGKDLRNLTGDNFNLELSHKIHELIHLGQDNAGVLHDPARHGAATSLGSRAAGLSVAQVEAQLNELFRFCSGKIDSRQNLSREQKFDLAAYFIHRYLDLHPYGDGNGRVARQLTSLLLIRLGATSSPLFFNRPSGSRKRYIDGLHETPVTGPESKEKLKMLVQLMTEAEDDGLHQTSA